MSMNRAFYVLLMLASLVLAGCGFRDTPSDEFLGSKLIVRPGVDDLETVTVRDFISDLSRVQMPNGDPAKLIGWRKTDSGYLLRVKIASEFNLNFLWSKPERLVLLDDLEIGHESMTALAFYMVMTNMPTVPASAVPPTQAIAASQASQPEINQKEGIAESSTTSIDRHPSNAVLPQPKKEKLVSQVTLQSFKCNDYCHLEYADAEGQTASALCMDTKECRAWSESPKAFMPFIGTKADLAISERFVQEGNVMVDNLVGMTLSGVPPTSPFTVAEVSVPKVPHLCSTTEDPVFACSTGKKRVSVCMTRSGNSEQLVYRLAPLEGALEMEHLSTGASATTAFQYGARETSDGKLVTFLSFDKGDFRYVVYDGNAQRQGVVVEQGGKRIANLKCQGEAMGEFDLTTWQRMGLARDNRGLKLP